TPIQKTSLHTNLFGQGAVLPNPQRFMCKGLSCIRRPDVHANDILALDYSSVCTFFIGDSSKPYFVGLLAKIPAASGFYTAWAQPAWFTQGYPEQSNIYHLLADANDPGVIISQGQNFGVTIDPTQNVGGAFTTAAQ